MLRMRSSIPYEAVRISLVVELGLKYLIVSVSRFYDFILKFWIESALKNSYTLRLRQ